MRVLVTGGRAPATLELVRLLAHAGHDVHVAESAPVDLCRWSRSVAGHHRVPAPNGVAGAFVDALGALIERLGIELLIPTCEEVFWVARGHAALSARCRVLGSDLDALRPLHSKKSFPERCAAWGLPSPTTVRVTDRAGLHEAAAALGDVVCKPEFGRFATHTLLHPTAGDLDRVDVSPERPWVIQSFVPGPGRCSWSVARDGALVAHAAYGVEWTAGIGSALTFEPLRHDGIRAFVAEVARRTAFTGQLAFDFVEGPDGVVPIECNPRLTSGIHLFADTPEIVDALVGPPTGCVEPRGGDRAMLTLPMLLYGLPTALRTGRLRRWWQVMRTHRDVVWSWSDPAPALTQGLPALHLVGLGLRHRVGVLAASTLDIEWNGQP